MIRRNEQSLLSLLRHFVKSYLPTFRSGVRVLPCSHIGRGLMCSGVVMMDHVCTWPIVFSRIFAFPSQFLDGFTLLVRIIPSPAPALYWRVTGNPGTQEVKTSALFWGLAPFQPWKYNSSLVTGKLNIACLNTGKLSWELMLPSFQSQLNITAVKQEFYRLGVSIAQLQSWLAKWRSDAGTVSL